jgi:UDP-glucose 4-epimerase
MKIVITGGLGHIGSRLIRELPAAFPDASVLILDNLSTQRYCSLFDLPFHGRYRFQETDVLKADLAPLFSGAAAVVHLAARTDAAGSFQNKGQVEEINYVGTERVAMACEAAGCPLIFLSTTSVYGLRPQSPYADSKLRAEGMLRSRGEKGGLRFITCRFGTIFGTSIGMRFHTAINKFCWQAVMGQPVTVWRTAMHQFRPYLDLKDAVDAIQFIIRRNLFDCNIYNVVTVNTSVNTIVETIKMFVPDLSIQYVDTEVMNQLSYHVSNKRFLEKGFQSKGDLEQGIRDTIGLFKGMK